MLNAEPSAPSVPNIVIGMTPSPSSVSEIPSSISSKSEVAAAAAVQLELPSTPSTPPVAVAAAPARDTLVAPAMPDAVDSEDDDDGDREPASEQRVRVADKVEEEAKVEAAPAKVEAKKEDLHDTIIDGQKIEIVKPAERHDDTLVDAKAPKMDEPAAKAEPKPSFEKTVPFGEPLVKEEKAEKTEAKAAPITQEEETNPPAGDLAVAEQFFSEGDVARHAAADDDDEPANDKAQRKSDPDVVLRRAKFAKYVTWAVGISAALCLVAVVRTVFTSSSKTIAAANAASAPVKSEIVVPKASPPPAVAPKPAETASAAAAPAAPAETAKPVITGDVKEEKAKVKAALDKNKLADAIEAGERAVAIDETDSEAWLLLGASYHQKGDLKEAQRAYHSCVEKGAKDKFQRECRLFAR